MSNLFKKSVATVAAASIVLSVVSPVVGVNAADTALDAANKLAKMGVIKTSDSAAWYNLGANITRREMLKIMMNLSSVKLEDTCESKFADLKSSDWGCKYAESALRAGFIASNPKFRPNDMVTEAEALKMIMQAKGIAKKEGIADWSKAYAEAAVEAGILPAGKTVSTKAAKRSMVITIWAAAAENITSSTDSTTSTEGKDDLGGLLDGLLGGDDNTSTESNTTETTTSTEGNTTETTTSTVASGDLEVSLNPASPAATNVPCNAQSLVYGKLDLTAGKADATVNAITLKRTGLGTKDDFSKVWLENQSGVRVTARQTIGSDDVVVLNFSPALVVKAGSTETLNLTAKLKAFNDNVNGGWVPSDGIKQSGEPCYTGRMDAFVIASASSVDANGGAVGGSFPITTAMMSTADYATANLTSSVVDSTPTYQVGELNQEFAQWRLTNNHSTRDIVMKTLTVKNEGTGKVAKDLANLKVVVNGNTISSGALVNGEYVTFNLNNYVLAAGRTESFYIRADVVGMDSATSDTIEFTVRYAEDLNAVESTTGFGVSHDLDTKMVVANTSAYTIKGGDTTFVKSSTAPASMTKPRGATNVTFLESNLIVKQDFTTDAIKVTLFAKNAAAATAAADLKNLKLYVDNQLVQTKSWDDADFTASTVALPATFNGRFTLNFDSTVTLKQGTRVIKLVWDIETNATSTNYYRAQIAGSDAFTSAKYISNDRTISTVAGTVTGGDVTIGASKLTITENSGYASAQKFVAGAQNLVAAKYTLKANDSDAVKVTRLKFGLIGGNGQINGSDIPSASVYVDGKQVGSTKAFTTGVAGAVDFTDVNFTVPSNGQSVVELKVNLTNSAANTLQVDLAQIDAKDSNGTDALINGLINDANGYQAVGNTVDSVALSIQTSGSLTMNNNSNTPTSAILVAGSSEQEIAKFTLGAQDDDIKVTNLYFKTVNTNGGPTDISSRVSTISLYDNAGAKVADGIVNGNYVYFDIGDSSTLVVPKNNNSYTITVKAKFNPITQSVQSGKVFKLLVDGTPLDAVMGTAATDWIRAVSTGNNTVLTDALVTGVNSASNAMMLTKTRLSFASVEDSSLVSTTTKLSVNSAMNAYAFSVTADAAGDVELNSVVLDVFTSNSGTTTSHVTIYEKGNESNKVVDNVALVANNSTTSWFKLHFSTSQRISAGTTKTYIVQLNVNAVATATSLSIKLKDGANDNSFTNAGTADAKVTLWSDLSSTSHNSTPTDGVDWFTGYKVNGLSSMTSRSYSNN